MTTTYTPTAGDVAENTLHRAIDWRGAFWVASGVPALVLFSIGGIAGTVGKVAFVVWTVSMLMGFIQSFTYAEIAGLFPNKSGGVSIYGAAAWVRYSKIIAPLSVWCNWIAWTPVLSLGCSIAAAYVLNALAPIPPADAPEVAAWIKAHAASIAENSPRVTEWLAANAGKTAKDAIDALLATDGVAALLRPFATGHYFRIRSDRFHSRSMPTFLIGAVLMLIVFAIQHRGILGTANVQKYIGLLGHHSDADRRRRADRYRTNGLVELYPDRAARRCLCAGPRIMEHSRLDARARRHVHRRLVDLRLRDGGLLHAASFGTRKPTPSRRSSTRVCSACCSTSSCRSRSRAFSALNGMLATPIVDGSGVAEAMGKMVGGVRLHDQHHGDADDPGAAPVDHDGDGRILANALPGLRRRLAAALSEPRQLTRRADARHVDRSLSSIFAFWPSPLPTRRASSSSSPSRTSATSSSTS